MLLADEAEKGKSATLHLVTQSFISFQNPGDSPKSRYSWESLLNPGIIANPWIPPKRGTSRVPVLANDSFAPCFGRTFERPEMLPSITQPPKSRRAYSRHPTQPGRSRVYESRRRRSTSAGPSVDDERPPLLRRADRRRSSVRSGRSSSLSRNSAFASVEQLREYMAITLPRSYLKNTPAPLPRVPRSATKPTRRTSQKSGGDPFDRRNVAQRKTRSRSQKSRGRGLRPPSAPLNRSRSMGLNKRGTRPTARSARRESGDRSSRTRGEAAYPRVATLGTTGASRTAPTFDRKASFEDQEGPQIRLARFLRDEEESERLRKVRAREVAAKRASRVKAALEAADSSAPPLAPEMRNEDVGIWASAVLDWDAEKPSGVVDKWAVQLARNRRPKTVKAVAKAFSESKWQGADLVRGVVRWICHWVRAEVTDGPIGAFGRSNAAVLSNKLIAKRGADSFGFAAILVAVLDELEVPCAFVRGYARHPKHKARTGLREPNHAWNIVKLPDSPTWMLVDVAMCSGSWQDGDNLFHESYLFMHPQQFAVQHFPVDIEGWEPFFDERPRAGALQMLTPEVSRGEFWAGNTPSIEFFEFPIFIAGPDRASRAANKSKIAFDIACNIPVEFDVRMLPADSDETDYTDCASINATRAILQRGERGMTIFEFGAVFPTKGVFKIEILCRNVESPTYKFHSLVKFDVAVGAGVFDNHKERTLAVGRVRPSFIMETEVREVLRNSTIIAPSGGYHFVRDPFRCDVYAPREVSRVAFCSNVYWRFLERREPRARSSPGARVRFVGKVVMDKSRTFDMFFEIKGRFVRAASFRGHSLKGVDRPPVDVMKSSSVQLQTLLADIKDSRRQQLALEAGTKQDGYLDMDLYGRCLAAELQVEKVIKETRRLVVDMRSLRKWQLGAVCFRGWHNKSSPLAHAVQVTLRSAKFEKRIENDTVHTFWRIEFVMPKDTKTGDRFSMQFNIRPNASKMARYAMTYYYRCVEEGPPKMEDFFIR